MIKEVKAQKEVSERHKFCDSCHTEITIGLRCSSLRCEYCKRDLCENCIGHEDETGSDYRIVWCKRCWRVGEIYHTTIERLKNEVEQLYTKWESECKLLANSEGKKP